MSFKALDRTEVRTRDLILEDGQSYDQYYDPMLLAARKLWEDAQAYESHVGVGHLEGITDSLKV